jgi:hypothetical protein
MYTKTVLTPKSFGNQFGKLHFAATMKKPDSKADLEKQKNQEIQRNKDFATQKLQELKDKIPEDIIIKIDSYCISFDNRKTRCGQSLSFSEPAFMVMLNKILQKTGVG